ncbi:hypothetical protein [Lutibacter citreus]|uniref:hypothetical protein n=1 Tax=Lutibacter citreus TaxID=2138210 RepID=UPI00130030AC|nr:hypothetical protein [Lutibacter citreus]
MQFKNNLFITISLLLLLSCGGNKDELLNEESEFEQEETIITTINSVITFNEPGQLINVFYYDVKFGNKAVTSASQAKEIFGIDDLNGIRIPIFGNINKPAHPNEGVIIDSYYEGIINSINFAKEARGTKEFKVFASKKLDGADSFPDWVKDDNGIVPEKYAILLADFIEFMNSENIQIDYLGIDNEFIYNEGNITPEKYSETIDFLRNIALTRGFEMPLLLGYDDYGPNKRNWVKTLMDNNWGDKMDVYGTHYYPEWRPKTKLLNDLALIGNRPFWSTEPHWNAKSDVNDLDEAEAGMVSLWDQIDVGMSGFMWWGYGTDNSLRSNLMRAASVPLLGSRPIKITDVDGEDITELGKLQTRAFIEDKSITVYAINMSSSNSFENYTFKLDGGIIEEKVYCKQWSNVLSNEGDTHLINPIGDNSNVFSITLPKRSISRFVFTIK